MKQIRFVADIKFNAEDGEDAARQLSAHFDKLADEFSGESEESVLDKESWFVGNMQFGPVP